MIQFRVAESRFAGPGGTLPILEDDEVSRKLAMLIDGECGEDGPAQAAAKFGFCRQRYFQLRVAFMLKGASDILISETLS